MIESELDVLRCNRHTIVPIGVVAKPDLHCAKVIGNVNTLGKVSVNGIEFVISGNEQTIVQRPRWRSQHKSRIHAPVKKRRQAREIGSSQHQRTPFGGVRVGIFKVQEIRRILQISEHRNAVLPSLIFRYRRQHQQQYGQPQHKSGLQHRSPIPIERHK